MSHSTEAGVLSTTAASAGVAVERVERQFRTVAARRFAAGDVVLELDGVLRNRPTRYSVQVGVDQHLEAPEHHGIIDALDRYQWRFLNHSCEPNSRIEGRTLIAIRGIPIGAAVTFDYDTNEWLMAEPFSCLCGAPTCRQVISGYANLSDEVRASIASRTSPHLLQQL